MGPKAKGQITKEYFPAVTDRLNMKINITHNFTCMVTGHGNISSYLHRFKIILTPACRSSTKDQTIDHLLFECELINKERENLKSVILKTGVRPISKNDLIRDILKHLLNLLTKSHMISSTTKINLS